MCVLIFWVFGASRKDVPAICPERRLAEKRTQDSALKSHCQSLPDSLDGKQDSGLKEFPLQSCCRVFCHVLLMAYLNFRGEVIRWLGPHRRMIKGLIIRQCGNGQFGEEPNSVDLDRMLGTMTRVLWTKEKSLPSRFPKCPWATHKY